MIVPPTNVRVLIATKPVDFRRGIMGLAAIVEAEFKADPFSGVIYVFRSKRADRVKLYPLRRYHLHYRLFSRETGGRSGNGR